MNNNNDDNGIKLHITKKDNGFSLDFENLKLTNLEGLVDVVRLIIYTQIDNYYYSSNISILSQNSKYNVKHIFNIKDNVNDIKENYINSNIWSRDINISSSILLKNKFKEGEIKNNVKKEKRKCS